MPKADERLLESEFVAFWFNALTELVCCIKFVGTLETAVPCIGEIAFCGEVGLVGWVNGFGAIQPGYPYGQAGFEAAAVAAMAAAVTAAVVVFQDGP